MIAKPKYTVMIDVIGLGLLCVMMLRFAWVGHFGSSGIFAGTVDRPNSYGVYVYFRFWFACLCLVSNR